jgi:hypothetical protein
MELFGVHNVCCAECRFSEVGASEGGGELFLREYRTEVVRVYAGVATIPSLG